MAHPFMPYFMKSASFCILKPCNVLSWNQTMCLLGTKQLRFLGTEQCAVLEPHNVLSWSQTMCCICINVPSCNQSMCCLVTYTMRFGKKPVCCFGTRQCARSWPGKSSVLARHTVMSWQDARLCLSRGQGPALAQHKAVLARWKCCLDTIVTTIIIDTN